MGDFTLVRYCFIANFLKVRCRSEDLRVEVSDTEIITIGLTAMLDCSVNFKKSRLVFYKFALISQNLSRQRFSRLETHKSWMRNSIETLGKIEKMFQKKIHASNLNGFILIIAMFDEPFKLKKLLFNKPKKLMVISKTNSYAY